MKAKAPLLLLGLGLCAVVLIYGLGRMQLPAETGKTSLPVAAREETKPAGNQLTLTLETEKQHLLALKTERLPGTNLVQENKVQGRVLETASLAEMFSELTLARVTAEASRRDYERQKTLGENTSVKLLQAAELAAEHDHLAVNALETKMKLAWGRKLAAEMTAGFAEALARGEQVVVQLELAPGETITNLPSGARVFALSSPGPVQAEFLERALKIDEKTQAQGFLFLVRTNAGGLVPGMMLTGYMQTGAGTVQGVIVPAAAILRHNGQTWVFVKRSENTFERHKITLAAPVENGWFSPSLAEGDEVVSEGAETLLSEENKAEILPE